MLSLAAARRMETGGRQRVSTIHLASKGTRSHYGMRLCEACRYSGSARERGAFMGVSAIYGLWRVLGSVYKCRRLGSVITQRR